MSVHSKISKRVNLSEASVRTSVQDIEELDSLLSQQAALMVCNQSCNDLEIMQSLDLSCLFSSNATLPHEYCQQAALALVRQAPPTECAWLRKH